MSSKSVLLGVDIGGTKVAAGLVTSGGEILTTVRVPMVAHRDAAAGFGAVQAAIEAVLRDRPERPSAIGITAPGPVDPRTGMVLNPPNLPCWHDFPLAEQTRQTFDLPAYVDNDGNAAGLAEALWGAGVGFDVVFCATIGTGIGTGLVFGGKIYHGRTGAAAEGGHVSIDYGGPRCACGKAGCIEAYAAGPAIGRRGRQAVRDDPTRGEKLLSLVDGDSEKITAEIVSDAYRAGDDLAREILVANADYLAIWLGSIIDLLEPDVIVVGGGVGELTAGFFDHIHKRLPGLCINQRCNEIPLLLAKYKSEAGIAGAAALCLP